MAWSRLEVRLPQELRDAVTQECARLGIKPSEFMRSALAAHVMWHRALDAVDQGHTTDELRDPETIARLLGEDT